MRGNNDSAAKAAIGAGAYSEIPKSVFALVADHLAAQVSDGGDNGTPLAVFLNEVRVLGENGIITPAQVRATERALA